MATKLGQSFGLNKKIQKSVINYVRIKYIANFTFRKVSQMTFIRNIMGIERKYILKKM